MNHLAIVATGSGMVQFLCKAQSPLQAVEMMEKHFNLPLESYEEMPLFRCSERDRFLVYELPEEIYWRAKAIDSRFDPDVTKLVKTGTIIARLAIWDRGT